MVYCDDDDHNQITMMMISYGTNSPPIHNTSSISSTTRNIFANPH